MAAILPIHVLFIHLFMLFYYLNCFIHVYYSHLFCQAFLIYFFTMSGKINQTKYQHNDWVLIYAIIIQLNHNLTCRNIQYPQTLIMQLTVCRLHYTTHVLK